MRVDEEQRIGDHGGGGSRRWWPLAVIALVAVAAWLGYRQGGQEDVLPAPVTTAPPVTAPAADPPLLVPETAPDPPPAEEPAAVVQAEPEPDPLPSLDDSDPLVRDSLTQVLGPSRAELLLPEDEIIRRQAVILGGLANGEILRKPFAWPTPEGEFRTARRQDRLVIATENYARYEALVVLVESIDPDTLVTWMQRFEPLIETAWGELGESSTSPRDALRSAVEIALATPEIAGDLDLVQPSVLYRFADPSLEALPDIQKLLLRMGPENRARIKRRGRDLLDALDRATEAQR
jgi:hypothetical protein